MKYNISVKEFISGDIDYDEFIAYCLKEAEKINKKFGFFRSIVKRQTGSQQPILKGLPVSVKDCICTEGIVSSAGSKILDGYVPPFDATSVKRIKEQSGFVIGKTNQDEFGFGTFSTNSGYEVPKNPRDSEKSCGGSSGGAAGITAAATFPHIALAESTGGSISCPAAFCGVVGITPTYGLVSRYGLIDYANSLDKIGTMGKTVYDAALGLSIIAGHDKKDSTSLQEKRQDYTKTESVKGMKIAVPKEYFNNIDEKVSKDVWNAIKKLESEGAEYSEVSLPTTKYAISAYYIIATAEASTNLSKFCGMRYGLHLDMEGNFNEYFSNVRSKGFGNEAKRRIILGTFTRMSGYRNAYYLKAMKVRTLIINDFKRVFNKHDVIAAPTMPTPAIKFSEIEKLTPLENYQMDVLTCPANLAGVPHVSVPCGDTIGLHLIADHLQEKKAISAAAAYEGS